MRAAILAAVMLAAIAEQRAEACSGGALPPSMFYPFYEPVTARSHFLLGTRLFDEHLEVHLIRGSASSFSELTVERLSLIGANQLLVVRPVVELVYGETYRLVIRKPDQTIEEVSEFTATSEVEIPAPAVVKALEWYDQVNISPSLAMCLPPFLRAFHLEVELDRPLVQSSYLHIQVEGNAEPLMFAAYDPGQQQFSLDQYLPVGFEPSCFTVWTVAGDGDRSDLQMSSCAPVKCADFDPKDGLYADWSKISGGCDENVMPVDPNELGGLKTIEPSCGCGAVQRGELSLFAMLIGWALFFRPKCARAPYSRACDFQGGDSSR